MTSTKGDELVVRIHKFYYGGKEVAAFVRRPDPRSEAFTTITHEAICRMSLEFSPSNEIEKLIIFSDDVGIPDGFTCFKGIFQPMTDADLRAGKARW